MSMSHVVPSEGETITAHSTRFTTEVDQRIDTGPWAAWGEEGAQQGLSFGTRLDCWKKE